MNQEKKTPLQIAVRILIIVGLFIILLLLSFGIIKLVPKALDSLSFLREKFLSFGAPKESLVVSTNKTSYESDEQGTLEWKQLNGKAEGYYAFSYTCTDSIKITRSDTNEEIVCETEVNILDIGTTTPTTNNTSLLFINPGESATTTLIITHRGVDGKVILSTGKKSISIEGEDNSTPEVIVTSTTTTPIYTNPKPVNTNPKPTPVVVSPADLTVAISQFGVIRNGVFIATSNIEAGDKAASQFIVSNRGGKASGQFKFKAYLPTNIADQQIYDSNYQTSIGAGQSSYFTIGWDAPKTGSNEFSVIVDSGYNISESNEANNKATRIITLSGSDNTGEADLTFTGDARIDRDGDERTVSFTVINNGGESTGTWSFNIEYDGLEDSTDSRTQSSLLPGQSRYYTLKLDNVSSNIDYITIDLDNEDDINESSESNNDLKINI